MVFNIIVPYYDFKLLSERESLVSVHSLYSINTQYVQIDYRF